MFGDAINRVGRGRRDGLLERREPLGQRAGDAIAMFGDAAPGLARGRRDGLLESREPFARAPATRSPCSPTCRAASAACSVTTLSNAASRSVRSPGHAVAMFGDAVRGLARGRRDRLLERREPFGQSAGRAVAMFADAVGRVLRAFRDGALKRREPFGQSPGDAVAMFGDAVRGLARRGRDRLLERREFGPARRPRGRHARRRRRRVISAFRDDALERREPFGQSPGGAVALLGDAVRGLGDAVRGLARGRRDRLLERRELFGQRAGHAVAMRADAVRRVARRAVTRFSKAAICSESADCTWAPWPVTRSAISAPCASTICSNARRRSARVSVTRSPCTPIALTASTATAAKRSCTALACSPSCRAVWDKSRVRFSCSAWPRAAKSSRATWWAAESKALS